MTSYLKQYIDRAGDVPPQLHRLFSLIKDLDQKMTSLQVEMDGKCKQQLEETSKRQLRSPGGATPSKKQKTTDNSLTQDIQKGFQEILSLAEEKVMRAASGIVQPTCRCCCSYGWCRLIALV